MVQMLTIPGVACKTANVVLGNVWGNRRIAVDTHDPTLAGAAGRSGWMGGKEILYVRPNVVDFKKMPIR
jgi:endonuclease III